MTNSTDHGHVFTASDGNRYRATGEFRPGKADEYWIQASKWAQPISERRVYRANGADSGSTPVIIVEPVKCAYEVTVTLTQEQLDDIADRWPTVDYPAAFCELIKAVATGNYREVEG